MAALSIRKIALTACLAVSVSLPIPMWTATRAMLAIGSPHGAFRWAAIVLAYLFSAILPVFYFVLSRSEGVLRLSKNLRLLSLAGAAAGGMVIVAGLPLWLDPSRSYLTTAKMLLSDFATLACILLLIAFFRQPSEAPGVDFPVSKPLRVAATVAVIAGEIWFTFNLAGLFVSRLEGAIRTLLDQVCLFTAPFVVYRFLYVTSGSQKSSKTLARTGSFKIAR